MEEKINKKERKGRAGRRKDVLTKLKLKKESTVKEYRESGTPHPHHIKHDNKVYFLMVGVANKSLIEDFCSSSICSSLSSIMGFLLYRATLSNTSRAFSCFPLIK